LTFPNFKVLRAYIQNCCPDAGNLGESLFCSRNRNYVSFIVRDHLEALQFTVNSWVVAVSLMVCRIKELFTEVWKFLAFVSMGWLCNVIVL